MGTNWSDLFPTKLSVFIFLLYMSLFVSQGILVTASQEANSSYNYNIVTVVLLTEISKLFFSTCLYCRDDSFSNLIKNVKKEYKVLLLYFVPAFLYCLYNNLSFINLSKFDPTTYYLLLQLRVVITGILFQFIFKKYLSSKQWFSLILLTMGCMLKQVDFPYHFSSLMNKTNVEERKITGTSIDMNNEREMVEKDTANNFDFSISVFLILAQTVCSCLAGIYNEYLLKHQGSNINIFIQNVFMYIDSIICNAVILLIRGELLDIFSYKSIESILLRINVIMIILNNTAIGIVTSFFLKHMNSILKTFASALELAFTAILSYLLFSIPIYLNTILSISVVSLAIYLYTQNPVVNLGSKLSRNLSSSSLTKESTKKDNIARRHLLSPNNSDSSIELEMEEVV